MNTIKNTLEVTNLPPASLVRSATNPRKRFDERKLHELMVSVMTHGVLQPILVRPAWCVGWDGDDDLKPLVRVEEPYEVIAGERRFRAGQMGELEKLPCVVRILGDSDALEIQLIENLQRDDLSPIEQAEGFQQMLDLRDDQKRARYTAESLAQKVGCSTDTVYRALKLLKLPEKARDALESGRISPTVASMIGRLPENLRERAASEIIYPTMSPDAFSVRQAEEWIQTHYTVSLATAKFSLDDAALCPEAGSCASCPKRSGNSPEFAGHSGGGKGSRADMCTDLDCFKLKSDAAWRTWEETHMKPGQRPLARSENDKLFNSAGEMIYSSKYVRLRDHPEEDLLRTDAREVPTWRELVDGSEIEHIVARDPKSGKTIMLVERKVAVAAAKLKPENVELFKRESGDSMARRTEADLEAEEIQRKARREESGKVTRRIYDTAMEASRAGLTDAQLATVVEVIIQANPAGILARREVTDERTLYSLLLAMSQTELLTVIVDFAFGGAATGVDFYGAVNSDIKALGRAFGCPVEDVQAKLEEEARASMCAPAVAITVPALQWSRLVEGPENFAWSDSDGFCENPDVAFVPFREASTFSGILYLAEDERGWVGGYQVASKGTVEQAFCERGTARYVTRNAALLDALDNVASHLPDDSEELALLNAITETVPVTGVEFLPVAESPKKAAKASKKKGAK